MTINHLPDVPKSLAHVAEPVQFVSRKTTRGRRSHLVGQVRLTTGMVYTAAETLCGVSAKSMGHVDGQASCGLCHVVLRRLTAEETAQPVAEPGAS